MQVQSCPQCGGEMKNYVCPRCGYSITPPHTRVFHYEWRSKTRIFGFPLVHVAIGRNRETGRLLVAKGIIAIGQFAVGLITISQFGVGLLLGIGQLTAGFLAIGQVALGGYFGVGQLATGLTAIGQLALGKFVLAQVGIGRYVWSADSSDPVAIEYFTALWNWIKSTLAT